MGKNIEYPVVGLNDIGIINNTDDEINIVAFELDKLAPFEGGDVYAWKVIHLGAGDKITIDVTPQYSAVAEAENIQSNTIKLELPGGNYYELSPEFELLNIGILNELQPVGSFYFHLPPKTIQKYLNKLSIKIIRAGDPVITRKYYMEFNRIEYSFGVFLGCVPDTVVKTNPFYLSELKSNRASVQPGEIVEVWKDAQGKLQITPAK